MAIATTALPSTQDFFFFIIFIYFLPENQDISYL